RLVPKVPHMAPSVAPAAASRARPAARPRRDRWRLGAATLAALLGCPAADAALPASRPVPGGVAIVDVGPATGPPPSVLRDTRRVLVIPDAGHWYAVVG